MFFHGAKTCTYVQCTCGTCMHAPTLRPTDLFRNSIVQSIVQIVHTTHKLICNLRKMLRPKRKTLGKQCHLVWKVCPYFEEWFVSRFPILESRCNRTRSNQSIHCLNQYSRCKERSDHFTPCACAVAEPSKFNFSRFKVIDSADNLCVITKPNPEVEMD